MAGMCSAEECYCNVRRYSAGVMPVARRNARVKLDFKSNLVERRAAGRDHCLGALQPPLADVAMRSTPMVAANARVK